MSELRPGDLRRLPAVAGANLEDAVAVGGVLPQDRGAGVPVAAGLGRRQGSARWCGARASPRISTVVRGPGVAKDQHGGAGPGRRQGSARWCGARASPRISTVVRGPGVAKDQHGGAGPGRRQGSARWCGARASPRISTVVRGPGVAKDQHGGAGPGRRRRSCPRTRRGRGCSRSGKCTDLGERPDMPLTAA